jgi:hypothetical protein
MSGSSLRLTPALEYADVQAASGVSVASRSQRLGVRRCSRSLE